MFTIKSAGNFIHCINYTCTICIMMNSLHSLMLFDNQVHFPLPVHHHYPHRLLIFSSWCASCSTWWWVKRLSDEWTTDERATRLEKSFWATIRCSFAMTKRNGHCAICIFSLNHLQMSSEATQYQRAWVRSHFNQDIATTAVKLNQMRSKRRVFYRRISMNVISSHLHHKHVSKVPSYSTIIHMFAPYN